MLLLLGECSSQLQYGFRNFLPAFKFSKKNVGVNSGIGFKTLKNKNGRVRWGSLVAEGTGFVNQHEDTP